MVTSSSNNQYLQPDYISPLPSSYDSKKSPLALLAETCRNIGADTSTVKLSSSSIDHTKSSEYRKSSDSSRLSVSPSRNATGTDTKRGTTPSSRTSSGSSVGRESAKLSFKPYEDSPVKKSLSSADRSERVEKKDTSENIEVCDKKPKEERNSSPDSEKTRHHSQPKEKSTHGSSSSSAKSESSNSGSSGSSSEAGKSNSSGGGISNNANARSTSAKPEPASQPTTPSAAPTTSSTPITYTTNGLEELAKSHSLHLSGQHKQNGLNCNGCLPSPYPHLVPESVKYLSYPSLSYLTSPGYSTRLPGSTGHCPSPAMCRDPFCAGCRLSAVSALGSAACPSGCTQCNHNPMGGHLTSMPPSLLAGNAGLFSGGAGLQRPNICSWMVGNSYCGKRFATSEELLQHLRTHTSVSDPTPTPISSMPSLGHYPHLDPMLTSPVAGLRRTAFDPVNRYHPYKPFSGASPMNPMSSVLGQSMAGMNPHQNPGLNMHYPSYGPYAGRLGPPIPP